MEKSRQELEKKREEPIGKGAEANRIGMEMTGTEGEMNRSDEI